MTDNYIVLDTETTGLNPARDKVLEIGAARIEQGRVVETFETLIDTGVPIPDHGTDGNYGCDAGRRKEDGGSIPGIF